MRTDHKFPAHIRPCSSLKPFVHLQNSPRKYSFLHLKNPVRGVSGRTRPSPTSVFHSTIFLETGVLRCTGSAGTARDFPPKRRSEDSFRPHQRQIHVQGSYS